jgi:hypothetical protein
MSYFGARRVYNTRVATSSSTTTEKDRCQDEYTVSTSGISSNSNINVNKMNSMKINSSLKKTFEQLKKLKELRQNADKQRGLYYSSSNNIKTIKKKKQANSKYNEYKSEEDKLKKKYYSDLSSYLKNKTKKRYLKFTSNPKDKRLNKVACSLKALVQTISKCPTRSSGTVITSIDNFITEYERLTTTNKEFASGYIKDILKNRPINRSLIKNLHSTNPDLINNFLSLLDKITICS